MRAIVLTYDRNRCLTDHMIHQYRHLWPNNPFTFRIPFQTLRDRRETGREYIHTPPDIKGTMLTLLEGLDDQEWIFWCIDDKYPLRMDIPAIQSIHNWVREVDDASVDGVLCCRPKKLRKEKRLTGRKIKTDSGIALLERNTYKCIWIHQFLRVKVLRHLFESFPDEIPHAKAMDRLKEQVSKPEDHRIYVTRDTLSVFGESTMRGVITENCYLSLQSGGLPVPDWHSGELAKPSIYGKLPGRTTRMLRNLLVSPRYRTS